jgi:hypothetical protein
MHHAHHLTISIARAPADVYAFASDATKLPLWASGLARAEVHREGDRWRMDSPMGRIRLRFAEPNAFGVLDHEVEIASGQRFHNPMRVLPNGEGSEVVFTLFRTPEMTDAAFAEDMAIIEADLRTLKSLLEGG